MKLNWDTKIPSDLMKEWNDLLKNLNDLDTVEVNRNVFVNYEYDSMQAMQVYMHTAMQVYMHTASQFMLKLFCNHGKFIPMS